MLWRSAVVVLPPCGIKGELERFPFVPPPRVRWTPPLSGGVYPSVPIRQPDRMPSLPPELNDWLPTGAVIGFGGWLFTLLRADLKASEARQQEALKAMMSLLREDLKASGKTCRRYRKTCRRYRKT